MKTLTIILSSLFIFTATGCSSLISEPEVTDDTAEIVLSSEEEMHNMMMDMPGELTAAEAAEYQADLPLDERIELAHDLAMKMPLNGMDLMRTMFPDLETVEEIANDDSRNMMKMGPEALLYSEEGDFTVQTCVEANSPIHVFDGSDPSEADFEEAMEMMEEMMMHE